MPPPPKSQAQLDRERARWEWEQEQDALRSAENDRLDYEAEDAEPMVQHLAQRLASPDTELTPVEDAAKRLLADARFELELANERSANARLAKYAPASPEARPEQKSTDAADTDLLVPGIFDQWKAEGTKRPKTIDMVKKSGEWFQARIGKLRVQDIQQSHVLDFKRKLQAEGQSVANINVRLSHISLLLGWAKRNGIVPANVAEGSSIPNPQGRKGRRKPFDLAALKAIFSSPVFVKGERPISGKGEAAYWLPVIALYTGARVRELAQLRRGDVRELEYPDAEGEMHKAWFLNITEDTDDEGLVNAIKNAASERLVPVHPKLIELGFIRYVQGLTNQRGRIFPDLPEDKYGNPAAKWGEWFSQYLRKVCLVTDKRMTFHSFRHTFKDYARNALMAEGIQRQIMGHEGGDVADSYGDGYSLHVVVDAMATYKVPGLTIIAP